MGLSVWKSLRVLLNQRLLGGGGRGAYEGAEEWTGGDWRWGILAVKENGVAWSPNMGGWQRFPNLAVDPNPLEGIRVWLDSRPLQICGLMLFKDKAQESISEKPILRAVVPTKQEDLPVFVHSVLPAEAVTLC